MEVCWSRRRAGSFTEIGIRLILFARNCLDERAYKTECSYEMLAWHVMQEFCNKHDTVST